MPEPLTIQLRTLTPLWTGGVDQTCDRLHETGLIGSLRWWYEALVRGLGGYACDPTDDDRCPDKKGKHCAACELFGCTGWARKFRLRVTGDADENIVPHFVELRKIHDAEGWLLVKAVEIAAKYGSIGRARKTGTGKGGDEFGIVSLENIPVVSCDRTRAKGYLHDTMFRHLQSADWPRLDCFFFVQKVSVKLEVIKKLTKSEPYLKGELGKQGKKVFSFSADGGRVWGYARDAVMRDRIAAELRKQLGADVIIQTGGEVIDEL